MLISRRSHRESPGGLFRSPLREREAEPPAVRYRRIREALYGKAAYVLVQVALLGAVIALALTLASLFRRHGTTLDPLYVKGTLGVVCILILLMIRRVVGQVRQLLALRRDQRQARAELDDPAAKSDPPSASRDRG